MLARLIVVRGPDKGTVFEIPLGFSGQLGRGQDAEFRLSDATVSRLHCHLEHDTEGLMVVNLSTRQTLLDGQGITNYHIGDAQTIVVGETHLRLCLLTDDEATSTRTKDQIGSPEGFLLPNHFPTASRTASTAMHPVLPQGLLAPRGERPKRRFDWRWVAVAACVLPLVFGGGLLLRGGGKPKEVADADAGTGVIEERGLLKVEPPPVIEAGTHRLHLLAVGVSNYKNRALNLTFADSDATLVHDTIHKRVENADPKLFSDVKSETLTNEKATRQAILDAFEGIKDRAVRGDLVLLSMSGHGVKDGLDNFYFLPHDYQGDGTQKLASTAISWQELINLFSQTKCRVVVLLDACHSGAAGVAQFRDAPGEATKRKAMSEAVRRHLSSLDHRGMVVMSGCLAGQKAQESADYRHGALTLAFCEAIGGKRLWDGMKSTKLPNAEGGRVSWQQVADYAEARVEELSKNGQRVDTQKTPGVNLKEMLLGGS